MQISIADKQQTFHAILADYTLEMILIVNIINPMSNQAITLFIFICRNKTHHVISLILTQESSQADSCI